MGGGEIIPSMRICRHNVRRKLPPCPPKMQCTRVPMPDGLLPRGVFRNHRNRKIHLSQALTFLGDHSFALAVSLCRMFRSFILLVLRRLILLRHHYPIHYPIHWVLPNSHLSVLRHWAFCPRPRHSTCFLARKFFNTRRIMSTLTFGHSF